MNSILEPAVYDQIITRIQQLEPDSERRWGKMTPNQMICHVSDPLRDILEGRTMKPLLPAEVQKQVREIVFGENEWAHSLPALPPYSQDDDGLGTRPTNFEADKNTLLGLLEQLHRTTANSKLYPHAGMDILSREEAGSYAWRHLDYHLRQFGI